MRICSVVQLCVAVELAEGVMVTGDFGCCAFMERVKAEKVAIRAILLAKRMISSSS